MADDRLPWMEVSEPDWRLVRLPHTINRVTFLHDPDSDRVRIQYYYNDAQAILRARVWFGEGAQGPPGHAHGGSIAAVLDEGMGGVAWLSGHPVLAAELKTRFRQMVPLGAFCRLDARIEKVDGRKVTARGRLSAPDGELLAQGTGLFVALDPKQLVQLAEQWNAPAFVGTTEPID